MVEDGDNNPFETINCIAEGQKLVDAHLGSDDEESKLQLLLKKLDNLPSSELKPHVSQHIRGYILYALSGCYKSHAIKHFKLASEEAIIPSLPLLYLAHCYYDKGLFRMTQSTLAKIETQTIDPVQRMHVEELNLCCKLLTACSDVSESIHNFIMEFHPVNYYMDFPAELDKQLRNRGSSLGEWEP